MLIFPSQALTFVLTLLLQCLAPCESSYPNEAACKRTCVSVDSSGIICSCVHQCSPLSLSLTLRIGKSLCSRRVFFLLQKNSSSCLDSCNFLTKVKSLSAITGDGSLLPTPVNLSVTNRSYTSISLQWEAVKNTNGSPVYMIEIELIKRGLRNIPINMKKVK